MNVNALINAKSVPTQSALDLAAMNGDESTVSLPLTSEAAFDLNSNEGYTPLSFCSSLRKKSELKTAASGHNDCQYSKCPEWYSFE